MISPPLLSVQRSRSWKKQRGGGIRWKCKTIARAYQLRNQWRLRVIIASFCVRPQIATFNGNNYYHPVALFRSSPNESFGKRQPTRLVDNGDLLPFPLFGPFLAANGGKKSPDRSIEIIIIVVIFNWEIMTGNQQEMRKQKRMNE